MKSIPALQIKPKQMGRRPLPVSIQQAARFNELLALSPDSPTGLVWRVPNRGIGAKHRSPGEYAGSITKTGAQRVGVDGKIFSCAAVRAGLVTLKAVQGLVPQAAQLEAQHVL
ncbi:hypothetical protein [Serratia odorifera]|uniref:hypothetical protein n=1 Tax=Serratia odorifera TaxID=618 RepID=UPI0018E862CF|nr:hypothetical protein [Serratia odorifera]MBJ2067968.1 hypothetical protein [Serratia odorifera]